MRIMSLPKQKIDRYILTGDLNYPSSTYIDETNERDVNGNPIHASY